ncbi:MAG: hypothetical protein IPP96_06675 [Chitinophagaceae bacterium]|nr:hypothetical protein [Chitinophagaceae bacterium]
MKKVFAILALATVMTACNNESEKTEAPAGDTTKTETPAAPAVVDTAMKTIADTAASKLNQMVDTAKKAVKEGAEKVKDAVKEGAAKVKEAVKH